MPRNAPIRFEPAKLELVQISNLAALAVAAMQQHARYGLSGFCNRREFYLPEIVFIIQYLAPIKMPILLPRKFPYDPCCNSFLRIGSGLPPNLNLLFRL